MEQVEVSLADIARIAGVRPSAVSNWRRRHEDFPKPAGGTDKNPRFSLTEVEAWLHRQGKPAEIPADERLWQAFDSVRGVLPPVDALVSVGILLSYLRTYPGTVVPHDPQALKGLMEKAQHSLASGRGAAAAGLMDTLSPFEAGAREMTLLRAVAEASAASDPAQTFEYLCSRYLDTGSRAGLATTPPELTDLMLDLAGPGRKLLLDPACGSGNILLSGARRGFAQVAGQELNTSLSLVAALRLVLAESSEYDVRAGDSLRQDAYPQGAADAVVCNPPFADRNWGLDELADDPRWEYDVPSRLESELAWVQHALAHVVPGGTVVMLMPPAAAARPSGRRVRQNLVRRGALRAVISLPPRLAAHYALALQIWILQRPDQPPAPSHLLFVDASGFSAGQTRRETQPAEGAQAWDEVRAVINRAWTAFNNGAAGASEMSDVALVIPVVDLLDEEVDLTPSRQLLAARPPHVSRDELAERHARLAETIAQLTELLPAMPGPGSGQGGETRDASLEELAQTGAIFIRRASARAVDDKEGDPRQRIRGRVLTGRDIARVTPPSDVTEVIADEVRNPPIRAGDVLVPLVGRRLTARVAADLDVGAYLSPTVLLIRPDPATIDPWFIAGFLSSSGGGRQAARMTSTLGEHIRFDPRRMRIPLLPIDTQRVHGEAFRKLWEFARTLRAAHDLGIDFVRDMLDVTVAPLEQTADFVKPQRPISGGLLGSFPHASPARFRQPAPSPAGLG
jgi:type I restriction-modification system DNA methylase subunit